jgi:hypothetical protein
MGQVVYPRLIFSLLALGAVMLATHSPSMYAGSLDSEAVEVVTASVVIPTYQYESALWLDPDAPFAPYERLDPARVGPPRPKTYQSIVLRNHWLELTILPELGGRLYRLVYRPTGQDLLYRNPVIKPTVYGARGWWLAAGGMEWAFPTDEHGYLEYVPWQTRLERTGTGGAVLHLSHHEQSTGLDVDVALTIEPGEASLGVSPRVQNDLFEARRFQLWVNAMVAFGDNHVTPGTTFALPVDQVILHSTGEPGLPQGEVKPGTMLDWPRHAGVSLDRPTAWHGSHFGAFASERIAFSAAHSTDAGLGLVRAPADPGGAETSPPRGAKVFGWGPAFDRSGITDDKSDYLELWAGLTPTFWDWATIEPGDRAGWDDVWYPVPIIQPILAANGSAAMGLEQSPDGPRLVLYAPRAVQARLALRGEETEVTSPVELGPDHPINVKVALELRQAAELDVRLIGDDDTVLLGARCHPATHRCWPSDHEPVRRARKP